MHAGDIKDVDIICYHAYSRIPLEGATATIFEENKPILTLLTDSSGIIRVKLHPGKYSMTVTRQGYRNKKLNDFIVQEYKINYIRVSLQPLVPEPEGK